MELASHLHMERFAVAGFSGGGPYALACAKKIPQHLTACGIIAGVGDPGWFLSFLAQWLPWLLLPISRRLFQEQEQAVQSLKRFAANWPAPDQKALTVSGISELMAASLVEALRPGIRGAAYDGAVVGRRNWGFSPQEVGFTNIYMWHGELDQEVPVAAARTLVKKLAHCKAVYPPEEGHISLIVNRAKEIVTSLTS